MSKKMQNDVRMAEAVYDVLEKYGSVWKNHEGFGQEVEDSKNLMTQLEETLMLTQSKSKGPTKNKAEVRKQVTAICVALAGRAAVYARKQNDIELLARLHAYESVLKRMAGNRLLDKLKNVYEALITLGSEVKVYDVTPEQIDDFKNQIENLRSLMAKPRVTQVAIKNYNKRSREIMKLIKESFLNLKDLLSSFDDKDFTNEFISARMIIDLGKSGKRKETDEDNNKDETTEKKN